MIYISRYYILASAPLCVLEGERIECLDQPLWIGEKDKKERVTRSVFAAQVSGAMPENSNESNTIDYDVTRLAAVVTEFMLGSGSMSNESVESAIFCNPLESFDSPPYKIIAVVCSVIGLFSLLCSSTVVLVILCSKKYRVFHQRLTLLLAVATIAHSLIHAFGRVDFSAERELTTPYCKFIGFANLYTSWVELLAITSITLNLVILSIYEKQVDRIHLLVHVILVYLSPLLWVWIPFTVGGFGVRGPWCGIRVHGPSCEVFNAGVLMRFALWQIPLYVLFLPLFIISSIVVFVKLKKRAEHWDGPGSDPEAIARRGRYKIFREIKPLLLFPIIYLLLKLPLLISQLYEAVEPFEPVIILWILEAIFSPLAGAMIAVMYGLDPQTRTKLRRCQLQSLFLSWCGVCVCLRKKERVAAYNVGEHEAYGDSVEGEAARARDRYLKRLSRYQSQPSPAPTE